ncbi:MAG: dihydrofolate reductase [Gammaproteobacteria bacterium]|nr:dihydrofolate reductase [Gammaproteobacteria bacterium]
MARPRVTLIVAMTDAGVIGVDGQLPWRLPEDLRRFKAATLGKPVIMGRKTFESIGRPLPQRHNIVLTRQGGLSVQDAAVTVVPTLEAALQAAGDVPEVMIIGGAEIYRLALPQAQRILRTRVHATVHGDTHFSPLDPKVWRVASSERYPTDSKHAYSMTFEDLERVS